MIGAMESLLATLHSSVIQIQNRAPPPSPSPAPMPTDPCMPSPCGPNADCRSVGDKPACSCLQNFIGSPPNCRPECIVNTECDPTKACITSKCRDPCPGSCGVNAECRVQNHIPICTCLSGYTGDPFTQCSFIIGKYIKCIYPLCLEICVSTSPLHNHTLMVLFIYYTMQYFGFNVLKDLVSVIKYQCKIFISSSKYKLLPVDIKVYTQSMKTRSGPKSNIYAGR
jgi:hypothetical protein